MIYWLHGYLLNQVLFISILTVADDLSKYSSLFWLCLSLPFCSFVPMGISSSLGCDIGNSAFSKQLVAGSIIVMHIKSITVLSFPLKVYGPMRSTHNASQGVVMASLPAVFHIYDFYVCSPDNYGNFWHVIGLSFVDLSNTLRDEEFPRDMWPCYCTFL